LNEPGVSKTHRDFDKYTKIIEYKNIDLGILDIISKKTGVFDEEFTMFYHYMAEHFEKNKKTLLEFIENKRANKETKETLTTDMYSMRVSIDYDKLFEKMIKIETK
jgi:hypothetical protein